jgi:hypothetical protein
MKENRSLSRSRFLLIAALVFAVSVPVKAQNPRQPPSETFSDRAASALLRQLSSSLQAHSRKNFLALFDLEKMKAGPLFKQQIDSFFAQADTITVHFNLAETNADAETPTFTVDAEMEVEPRAGGQASRVSSRVTFAVARAAGDWKIFDVQPRSFFSLP